MESLRYTVYLHVSGLILRRMRRKDETSNCLWSSLVELCLALEIVVFLVFLWPRSPLNVSSSSSNTGDWMESAHDRRSSPYKVNDHAKCRSNVICFALFLNRNSSAGSISNNNRAILTYY